MQSQNQTTVTEFILLGITGSPFGVKIFFFIHFLLIYIFILIGNLLIIVLVSSNRQLHCPMYHFLRNVSLCEILLTTVILPHILDSLLAKQSLIPTIQCFIQFYIMCATVATECLLFSVMSYDRYMAICNPLNYFSIMNHKLCLQIVISCWLSAYILAAIIVTPICTLQFCGPNVMDHFFCDFTPLLELSCSDTTAVQMEVFLLSFPVVPLPLVFIIFTYMCIIATILRMPMATSRQKAFSTCSAHLAVVSTYYGTLIIVYMVPPEMYSFNVNKFFSLLYSVATPLLNPIIYSLRNQEIQLAMKKLISAIRHYVSTVFENILTCFLKYNNNKWSHSVE